MSKEVATFAAGCFWCIQQAFDQIPGVLQTRVGYTGGDSINPTYEEVCTGKTGHFEAIEVIYDSDVVSYAKLLKVYGDNIDTTRNDGQFCDIGPQYRPAIFYHNDLQKKEAEKYRVLILPAKTFYPAEDYHQKYYQKQPERYGFYHDHSGRH